MLKEITTILLIGVAIGTSTPVAEQKEYDHTLADSVAEVLAPVNWLEVLPILLEAISWDEELQDVLEFLQGAEFRAILITTLLTLYNLDLDVYFYLNALHIILGLPIVIPRPPQNDAALVDLKFEDSALNKDALPIEEMGEIYYDKMENDDVLIAAMAAIGSPQFIEIGDAVQAMDEYQVIINKLEEKGIDTEAVLQALKDFFH